MNGFVEIPMNLYRQLTPAGDERTDLYRSFNPVTRWMFWGRLRQLSKLIVKSGIGGSCLDFGGGSGVMLPTLSHHFEVVTCMDLDTRLAHNIKQALALDKVILIEGDVSEPDVVKYEAIIAADVLEHFADLSVPIEAIRRRMSSDGWLFTSLPTETGLYETLRFLMRKKKPIDHYHTACEVEARLLQEGFRRVFHTAIPIPGIAPLFLISAWKLDGKP